MNGGLFWAHPWTAGGGDWCFRNEEPDHPLVASFKSLPTIFHLGDEIYMHPTPPFDRSKVRVLISLCLDDANTAAAMTPPTPTTRAPGSTPRASTTSSAASSTPPAT